MNSIKISSSTPLNPSLKDTIFPPRHIPYRNHFIKLNTKKMPSLVLKSAKVTASLDHDNPLLVVVGSANADIYVEINRLPKEGETISALTGQTLAGGKGANQAACGARLGYETIFIGQIEEDAHGGLVKDALEGCGVRLDWLRVVGGCVPTGHAVVMLQKGGQNSIVIFGGSIMKGWPEDQICFVE